jgi:hypothetical protein
MVPSAILPAKTLPLTENGRSIEGTFLPAVVLPPLLLRRRGRGGGRFQARRSISRLAP